MEAPPGFEPGMEVLQTRLMRLTCALVLPCHAAQRIAVAGGRTPVILY